MNEGTPVLKDKARTLGGYVTTFDIRDEIVDTILRENPEIG